MTKFISSEMKANGREIWQRWQVAIGHALRLRLLVNQVEMDFLRENKWTNKRTCERILLPQLAYMVSDIERYCDLLEEEKRKAGLMEGIQKGYCPALIAENDVIKIEWEILDWTGEAIGDPKFAENVSIYMDKRKQALELFDRLHK